ncbi:mfs transporter [Lecanosticta acicola]|uniref:Mfs transporter n=1 Tax=Lecanosticta acicola TaxID=111012 RepID=A0AAI8Z9H4_9PEZI|nr:mfs transporter [Lecanosticta acicola]
MPGNDDAIRRVDANDNEDNHEQHALGTVRLQDFNTKERILVPTPSNDARDPLSWSNPFRYYLAFLVCLSMILCNFLAAGPAIAMSETIEDLLDTEDEDWDRQVSQISFLFTTNSLFQGLGNLIWMPLVVKFGKRPVYIASSAMYTITAIWVASARTYANALVARIVMGFASGSGECIAPLTISDLFFLHERGTVMAMYTASLNFGVSMGIILSGLITLTLEWRYIYWIASAMIGVLTIVVFFTMPETSFARSQYLAHDSDTFRDDQTAAPPSRQCDRYVETLRLYNGRFTNESFRTLFIRPILMLALPPVLWATLVMAVTIGFLVAITSNFSTAFADTYDFEAWQAGLCFIAGLLGSGFGIFFGGWFSDWIADCLTRRNGGTREPEFRLPAMTIGLLTTPLALALYGAGIECQWHWTVPTVALGLLSFSIAQATSVSLVYIVDAYRPVVGETVVTQLAFKSAFGFLLSFYTNPWIALDGYEDSFGAMAGISACILVLWIPLFLYGKRIRHASLAWPFIASRIRWNPDRETGE